MAVSGTADIAFTLWLAIKVVNSILSRLAPLLNDRSVTSESLFSKCQYLVFKRFFSTFRTLRSTMTGIEHVLANEQDAIAAPTATTPGCARPGQ
jgi:hypothetical protein